MAKFYGEVGYGLMEETAPGVYQERIVKRNYYGDVDRIINHWQNSEHLNDDYKLNMQIKIVADEFAIEHAFDIRYVEYLNSKWKVTSIEVQRPRLILNFGGIYNEQS